MEIWNIIIGSVITGVVGLMWWDVRCIRKDTQDKLQKFYDRLNDCEVSLPKDYATRESVERLWSRTDRHESDISYIKGKFNGRQGVSSTG